MKRIISIALLALFSACSSTPSVEIHPKLSKGLGFIYTIENTDPFPWKNVTIEFNDNWTYKIDELPAGQSKIFLSSEAADDVGNRMNADIKVSTAMICCTAKDESACAQMDFKQQ